MPAELHAGAAKHSGLGGDCNDRARNRAVIGGDYIKAETARELADFHAKVQDLCGTHLFLQFFVDHWYLTGALNCQRIRA
jgi:hypothetical protein